MAENNDSSEQNLPEGPAKRRDPELLPSRSGTRMVSTAALVERIVMAFNEEHGEDSTALQEADTPVKRLKLLRDTVDYVLAVESVQLSQDQKASLIGSVYSERFGYGPLDVFFKDERITTIALEGLDKASVRYAHGDLTPIAPFFEDMQHFHQIVRRMLRDAGAELREDHPYIEVGLDVEGRPVCLNLVAPPITIQMTADIRVHPRSLPTLDDLVSAEVLTTEAASFLQALAASPHGVVVVGDTESGKTTILSLLAGMLPQPQDIMSVERAGELRLPDGAQSLRVIWPVGEKPGTTFADQVQNALSAKPSCIILDEVRADEPEAVLPLLAEPDVPRQIWAFRGPADDKRLRSALGMVARRADPGQGEALVQALYRRLPFIVTFKRARGRLELRSVAEWQFQGDSEYPDYVSLFEMDWDGVVLTGKRPAHALELPEDFWRSPRA